MTRRRKSSIADDIASDTLDILQVAPVWIGPLLAPAVFVVCRYVIPALCPSDPKQPLAVIGSLARQAAFILTFLVVALWLRAEFRKLTRRQLLDSQTGLETIRNLSWQDFEKLIGEAYRRQGYNVEERGGHGADGGIDLVLHRDGKTVVVQCKQWKARKVGVRLIRELYGVMIDEQATSAVLATCGRFTSDAKDFAHGKPIKLLGGQDLADMIGRPNSDEGAAKRAATRVACPSCGSPMVERVARTGRHAGKPFWGCSRYPDCRGILPIASVP